MAKQTFLTGDVLTAAAMTSLQQTAMGGGSTTAKTVSYTLVAADAGTVVQMNSASATTITVNTALFAAGDTVQIQNIGAGVCTVTAGTATVSTAGSLALSQYESGQLYFNTTSAALFFDVVQASGTASALTKIVTGTFSNAASTGTTFDGCFTSTYDNYMIIFSDMYASAGSSLRFQTRLAGSTQATSNYNGSYTRAATVTATSSASSYNVMSLQSVSTQQGAINMTFYRNTTRISWTYLAVGRGSADVNYCGAGFNDAISAGGSDGFIMTADTANIYGTITVYGVSK
jgi:hypothetical protein